MTHPPSPALSPAPEATSPHPATPHRPQPGLPAIALGVLLGATIVLTALPQGRAATATAIVLAATCAAATAIDITQHRIPNLLTGSAALAGLLVLVAAAATTGQLDTIPAALLATVATALIVGVIALASGTGMGDVKLLSALALPLAGLWAYAPAVLVATAFITNGVFAALALASGRVRWRGRLPMAPAITIAAAVAVHVAGQASAATS